MDKKSKIFIVIILVAILGISAFLLKTYVIGDTKNNTNSNSAGTVQNNTVNNVVENNTIDENNTINNEVNEVENTVVEDKTVQKHNSEISYTNGEEQAMKVAKDAWGDTEGVYFSKESITPNGEYVIVVTADAKVLARYTINVDTGVYDVEYR